MTSRKQKKLLVLDVNGLLVDTYFHREKDRLPPQSPDATIGNFFVYKRPFCDEFVRFCLENFVVGIWSSARRHNVENLVDYIFQGAKDQLAFMWHQADCTNTGLKHPENQHKPIFLKELSKLWEALQSSQPLEGGLFGPSNTLLVDDSPYKALRNPPYTGIFPPPYTAHDVEDSSLSGVLRKYLEEICGSLDVQSHVKENPFGEPSITTGSLLWDYYKDSLNLEEHAQYDGPVHLAKKKKLLSENSGGLRLEVPVKGSRELTEGTSFPQVQVSSASESEKVEREPNESNDKTLNTSTPHIHVEILVQSGPKDDLLEQNLERKQEGSKSEGNEQVKETNKPENGKNCGRIETSTSGHDIPIERLAPHSSSTYAFSYGSARLEVNRKYREESWGGDPTVQLSWHRNKISCVESSSILPGYHTRSVKWRAHSFKHSQSMYAAGNEMKCLDRDSQLYPTRAIPSVIDTPHVAARDDTVQRNSHQSNAYDGRFGFSSSDSSYVPASDAYNGKPATGLGYSDGKGRFYLGRCSGGPQNLYVNEVIFNESMHRSGHYDMFSFPDGNVDPYHCSQHHEQSEAYSFACGSRVPPKAEYSSCTSSSAFPSYCGADEHSTHVSGHGNRHLESMAECMDYRRNRNDMDRSSYGIPSIDQRFQFAGKTPEGAPYENGNTGHPQYKNCSGWHPPGRSYSRSARNSHVRR